MNQNDNFYLAEAFQQLKCLDEEAFDLSADRGVVDELQSFVADDIEAPYEEEIIDVDADKEDELQKDYVGQVILRCSSCGAKLFKDIADVILDDNSEFANVEEECPLCGGQFGFEIIGKVEPFDEEEFKDEEESEVGHEEEEVEEHEFSDDEIGEALKEALNEGCKNEECEDCDEEKCEEECDKELDEKCLDEDDKPAAQSIEDAQKWVDYDIKHYGHISNKTNELVKKAGFQIIKDDHGDYEVAVGKYNESCDESLNEDYEIKFQARYKVPSSQGQVGGDYLLKTFNSEKEADEYISRDDIKKAAYKKFGYSQGSNEFYVKPIVDIVKSQNNDIEDIEFEESLNEEVEVNINDDTAAEDAVKIEDSEQEPIKEELGDKAAEDAEKLVDPEENPVKESLKEGIENLSLDTEDTHMEMTSDENGRVEVVTEPRHNEEVEAKSEEEMIAPLSDEDKEAIMGNDGEMPEEEAPVEDEFAIDDFEEESFDELGESFLKRVYENVDSFNTTKATEKDGKLIVEGLIKFNSGKEKTTSFVFENFKNTRRGKVLVQGFNEMFSKSNKAFLLKGELSNKKFVSESLTYNYTAKGLNESNESESIRVYGRAVVKK